VNSAGMTVTPSNPSGVQEKFEVTGSPNTVNGAALPTSAPVVGTNSGGQVVAETADSAYAAPPAQLIDNSPGATPSYNLATGAGSGTSSATGCSGGPCSSVTI